MGLCGTACRIWFTRILPVLVVLVAVLVGWLSKQDKPIAVFFACVFPLMSGYAPPPLTGGWSQPGSEAVPADMRPAPRPDGERFLELPGGYKMPANGIGMCCRPTAYDPETVRRTTLWYLLLGGRHIDTADAYLNHASIGEAIREAISRGVPRSEIFVTTKIYPGNYGPIATTESVDRFLKELGLDYIDLVLMHFPAPMEGLLGIPNIFGECAAKTNQACRQITWETLSKIREKGLVRSVGVSNFNVNHLEEFKELEDLEGTAPIAVNQIQYNPWVPEWQQEVVSYCHKRSIAVTAYASLAGFMQKAETYTQKTLSDIATGKKVSVSQIMLRWALQKNMSIIPGTANPKHMRENLAVYQFQLSSEDMASIDALASDPGGKSFFFMKPEVD